jgi:hypothetical protein
VSAPRFGGAKMEIPVDRAVESAGTGTILDFWGTEYCRGMFAPTSSSCGEILAVSGEGETCLKKRGSTIG